MDIYKMDLVESLAKEYASLSEDDAAAKNLLKRKLWTMLERDSGDHTAPRDIPRGKSMIFAYISANAKGRNDSHQLQTVADYAEDRKIIIDRIVDETAILGEVYQSMKLMLRRGDTLIVKELSCLGYTTARVADAWRELEEKGVDVIIVDNEQISTAGKPEAEKTLTSKVVYEMLAYMAAKEGEQLRSGEKDEIAFMEIYKRWKRGEITVKDALEELNISQTTFYRRVKMHEKLSTH